MPVPGGGVALLNALSALDVVEVPEGDPTTGVRILTHAPHPPMLRLAQNAATKET